LDPVFADDGTLWMAYTKVETLFEEVEVTVDGELITVEDVPAPGRSDLYLLRHMLAPDLAISAGDISLSVANPAPGETVLISVTVHSEGDLAVAGGKVQIYDGFPEVSGVKIGEVQLLTSPLRAGMTDTITVEWVVPGLPVSHDIYVHADPFVEIFESDEMNNMAHITTVLPDLQVGDLYAEYESPETIRIVATIVNAGKIAASDVLVEWHQDTVTGTLLSSATVSNLAAGGSEDVTMTWTVSAGDVGEHVIYALVDPQNVITESDEENNADLAAADVFADLALKGSYVEVGVDAAPPDPLSITLELANEGVAEARDVLVRVVQGYPYGEANVVLYETTVSSLAAGGSIVLTADITIPGLEDVYALADPEWVVGDIYRGDNLALLVNFPVRIFLPMIVH